MKVLFVSLLLVAGAFARSAVQQEVHAEGPACPIADPLDSPGPDVLNVTLHPIAQIDQGSTRGDIHATGLSTLWYSVDINALLLTASFELTLTTVSVTCNTYSATGYIDARPFRQETIPGGNFTGSDAFSLSASGLHVAGRGSLWVNIIGNKVTLSSLTLSTVEFESLSMDLGEGFVIGGITIDWAAWSLTIKDNFEADWGSSKTAITDKIRLAANNIIGQYTLAELIDLIGGGGDGGSPEPCVTSRY